MTATALIGLAVKSSLALMVFAVGLNARPGDATYLLRHPGLLARSLVAMNVVMPLVALWFAVVFDLHHAVKLALIALAMSPVPPFLPSKALKSGGDGAYVVGLLTVASVIAVVTIPLTMFVLGALFATPFNTPLAAIVKIVGVGVLAPLVAGMAMRRLASRVADRLARPVTWIAVLLLVVAMIPILVTAWPALWSLVGSGTLVAIILMVLIGLAVGHFLGGPERDDRTVLALSTSMRHPAVAIALISTNFAGEKLGTAAVLLALIVGVIATTPYAMLSKRAARSSAPQIDKTEKTESHTDDASRDSRLRHHA